MTIKPNCQKCYYGGGYKPNEHLASCNAPYPKEPTVIKFDELFNRERQFVKRKNWDDECNCGNFIPSLSEMDGDFELEAVYTFTASFDCPFCGERIDVFDLGIEEIELVKCDECGKQIAVHGKEIEISGRKFFVDTNSGYAMVTEGTTGLACGKRSELESRVDKIIENMAKFTTLLPLEALPIGEYDEKTRRITPKQSEQEGERNGT